MYLQTGEEHQWLTQRRRSMEAQAARQLATTAGPTKSQRTKERMATHEHSTTSVGDPVRAATGRIGGLLRPRVARIGNRTRWAVGRYVRTIMPSAKDWRQAR